MQLYIVQQPLSKDFSLISTLNLELILSQKNPASHPSEFRLHGNYRQKRVKDLVTENLKGNWDVSQPFYFYSGAP